MKKIYIMVLIGLYGCSPAIRAYYNYDKNNQVQKYKTFNWEIEEKAGLKISLLHDDKLTDRKIKSAVNDLLRLKGYLITEAMQISHYITTLKWRNARYFGRIRMGYVYGDYFMRPRPDIFTYRRVH